MPAARPTRRSRPLRGLNVLITAGPTREYIDDVRFLSNASTGAMGRELARLAQIRGARVTLVHGPVAWRPPTGVRTMAVESTEDLLRAVRAALSGTDVAIFAAAPSDYRPVRRAAGKPAREDGPLTLALRPTRDVAAAAGRTKGGRIHLGFALEVTGGVERARKKLARKRFDAIVLNGPENMGRGGGAAWWIERNQAPRPLSTHSKARLARDILDQLGALLAR